MAACPKCGREYPVGSGNQCYNCFRDGKEHKRSGKRRPKPSSEDVPRGGARRNSLVKSLTPDEIRNFSKWTGSDFETIGLPEKSGHSDKTPVTGRASFTPTFGRRRPGVAQRSEPIGTRCLRTRREGVNSFLNELFAIPILLSDILAEAGYSSQQVLELKGQVSRFLPILTDRWAQILHRILNKSSLLVIRHFGLDGLQPRRGGEIGGSVARIHDMMFVLRGRKGEFRSALLSAAAQFLGPVER